MTKGQLEITVFEARNLNKLIHFTKGKYLITFFISKPKSFLKNKYIKTIF